MANDTGFGKVRIFDDFLGTMNGDLWNAGQASSATAFAHNAQEDGALQGGSADDSSADISVVYSTLVWRAESGGPLLMEARIKPITSLSAMYFVGFSNAAATEKPLDYNGSSFTSTAEDAVGFYYAGGETSATWRYGGTANSVDSAQAAVSSDFDPVVGTWQTLRVVVNEDGSGSFYIDGNIIAENVSGCVTAATAIMPFIMICDDGAAVSLDVDYILVSKGRNAN